MTIRVQIKNSGNSELISDLKKTETLIKRTGMPHGQHNDHLGNKEACNKNQGIATFDIKDELLHLVPNDSHVLINGGRISAKQYKLSLCISRAERLERDTAI